MAWERRNIVIFYNLRINYFLIVFDKYYLLLEKYIIQLKVGHLLNKIALKHVVKELSLDPFSYLLAPPTSHQFTAACILCTPAVVMDNITSSGCVVVSDFHNKRAFDVV